MNKPNISYTDSLNLLVNWVKSTRKHLYTPPDRKDLICYGTGCNNWGVQTNQKAFGAYGILAVMLETDCPGVSRAEICDTALKMLRFSLESHHEGSYHCLDNTKWGHTWISALGTERMMHAVDALDDRLTEQDKELLERVLVSEADWLLDHYETVADPDAMTGKNKPESNLWNGALLHRTAMMFPDTPRADQYRERGSEFLINSISVPVDQDNQEVIDGKTVAARYLGANFFETYALNHHGYLNVGYMVICLSNIAMLHFSFRKQNQPAPESLYHHAYDLWKLIKLCTFPDGRLLRIGGDTRVRYCYCQDYAIPMWLLMLDKYGETDCLKFENEWLQIITREQQANGDGSFISERTETLQQNSPLYFTRLESDRAVSLSMASYWRKIFNNFSSVKDNSNQAEYYGAWQDEFHGACFHKSENRSVSWVWKAAEKPQGLCLPTSISNLAEWKENLAGRIIGTGNNHSSDVISHHETTFPGGFITCGSLLMKSLEQLAEGQSEDVTAIQKIAFAALPDEATAICLQYAKTCCMVYLKTIKELMLQVPNDIFNDRIRTYYTEKQDFTLNSLPEKEELIRLNSSWVNVDDSLTVSLLYGGELVILRQAQRQIGIMNKPRGGGMLYVDEICSSVVTGLKAYDSGELIIDTGFAIQTGIDHLSTMKAAENPVEVFNNNLPEGIRAVLVTGVNNIHYLLVANFRDKGTDITLSLNEWKKAADLASGEIISFNHELTVPCLPNTARIYKLYW